MYIPIKNLDLTKFNFSLIFSEQGYDIYDKNSEFYHDICTSAYLGENDITLKDRKNEIYPDNITLCNENCEYTRVNIEDQTIICKCNLNKNKNYSDLNEEEFNEEDDGNFMTYLLDNINYQIFKCYKLLSSFENLNHKYSFYVIAGVFIVILIIDLIFLIYTLSKIKNSMFKELPTKEKVEEEIRKALKKKRKLSGSTFLNPPRKKVSKMVIRKGQKPKSDTEKSLTKMLLSRKLDHQRDKNDILIKKEYYSDKKSRKNRKAKTDRKKEIKINLDKKKTINNNKIYNQGITINEDELTNDDEYNDLPYTKAIVLDTRNVFQIFKSFLLNKLELISILIGKERIKIILLEEYVFSLLINFFFNTLLYSDEVVSKKYHNNGELDFFVSLTLSLSSNIITSIICYYMKYSKGIEERFDRIMEIKNEIHFVRNINQYFRFLKIKFICFLFSEIIIISACDYYILIFCFIYRFSQVSLLINYIMSLVEGITISFAITIIILCSRVIGLRCLNKTFYNLSKYINDNF